MMIFTGYGNKCILGWKAIPGLQKYFRLSFVVFTNEYSHAAPTAFGNNRKPEKQNKQRLFYLLTICTTIEWKCERNKESMVIEC